MPVGQVCQAEGYTATPHSMHDCLLSPADQMISKSACGLPSRQLSAACMTPKVGGPLTTKISPLSHLVCCLCGAEGVLILGAAYAKVKRSADSTQPEWGDELAIPDGVLCFLLAV